MTDPNVPDQYRAWIDERYNYPADFYIQVARETIEEWDYASDPHGYVHERSVLVGLLREIDRLRAAVDRALARNP